MEYTAEIKIDATQSTPIEDRVFGHFIEHLGCCIQNGIWDERGLSVPYAFGRVRQDVFDAMAGLRPPILRWPGGCFSDTYHWRDGVGPAGRRPKRVNRAWWWLKPSLTAFENNHFGTDEFLNLCGNLGAAPYVNINLGSGKPAEAAAWVSYCNAPVGTPEGDQRAANGHPEPYNVRTWGIGNELWGPHEVGFCASGSIYAKKFLSFHKAMKAADPTIETVAVGAGRLFPNWNRNFLKTAGHTADYLSLHEYVPGVNPVSPVSVTGLPSTKKAYYAILAGADMIHDSITWFQDTIERSLGPDPNVKIAFDEWNAWWGSHQMAHTDDFTLREGVFTACALSRLVKLSPVLGMAAFAQMVNVLGLIITQQEGMYLTPSYHAFKMYRDHARGRLLHTDVSCDTVHTHRLFNVPPRKEMLLLDVLAVQRDDCDGISVLIVNKHFSEPIMAQVSFTGFTPAPGMEIGLIYSESPFDKNSLEEADKVRVRVRHRAASRSGYRLTLPPHSIMHCAFVPANS